MLGLRPRPTSLVAGLALALLAAPAADARPRPAPPACAKLKRGDLAPQGTLRVRFVGDGETGGIRACRPANGRVFTLASWSDGLARDSGEVVATAGRFVLVATAHDDQYGGASRSLELVDVRPRAVRRRSLAGFGCQQQPGPQPVCPSGTAYGAAVLHEAGTAVVVVSDLAAGTSALVALRVDGTRVVLDADGAGVGELRLDGDEVVWTRGDTPQRAAVPGA